MVGLLSDADTCVENLPFESSPSAEWKCLLVA